MKWSYILYLPAIVAIAWAFIIVLTKKHFTRAQALFCIALMIDAFTITVAGVFFRGRVGSQFIYDYLFEVSAVFCIPMYYISLCALTEPRGATLRQRRVFLVPLLFIAGLTIGAFGMHPGRYQIMCLEVAEDGIIPWKSGDFAYNFMIFWNQFVFIAVLIVFGGILLFDSERKVRLFKKRFDSYYAQGLNMPKLNIREIVLVTWLFLPVLVITAFLIGYRPFYYKYWLIICAVLLIVIFYLTGHFAYRYDYDARFLADYIRNQDKEQ